MNQSDTTGSFTWLNWLLKWFIDHQILARTVCGQIWAFHLSGP